MLFIACVVTLPKFIIEAADIRVSKNTPYLLLPPDSLPRQQLTEYTTCTERSIRGLVRFSLCSLK